ncbi:ABC transporter permease [Alkalicoccobacillus murimartini]|uniref:Peptide/nickel transport system permease protein n=1 Tax=Alkalicoccobacillus murimartini TaxID=171685 RepID=A0ABT9YHY3_9BACI|nr:ABC transporter permease [Alkalicoccobacillus murimartini]MDQ0207294.1 peptide/nickel transport system permease protein [Alkalicoccobacillus murimartini]
MAGESVVSSNNRFLYKQVRFFLALSTGFTILLLLFSIEWTTLSIRPGVLIYTGIQAVFTLLQTLLVWQVKRDIQLIDRISAKVKILAVVLLFSLFVGNVFLAVSSLYVLKEKRSTAYAYASYMIITDVIVILVSSVNLFKPYVSNTFLPSMYALILILVLHIAFLCLQGRLEHLNRGPRAVLLAILSLTALTGNLFVLFTVWAYIKQTRSVTWIVRESLLDKLTYNNASMLGLFFILFLLSISITSIGVFDYGDAINNNYSLILQDPSLAHPFGTDNYGRDVFSRVIFGARISLVVGFLATMIPFIVGGVFGALSGYFGGRSDNVIMRALDVLYAIPGLLLAITIIAAFGANTVNLIIALSVGAIPGYARTMRANVLQVSTYEFVESARALGAYDRQIIFKHVIPNALAPMIVKSTLTVGTAVISTSSLSYLGLGVEPHIPEWGNVLRLGSAYLESQPHLAIFPGLAIILLVLSFNFLGDGLRDATDPKLS